MKNFFALASFAVLVSTFSASAEWKKLESPRTDFILSLPQEIRGAASRTELVKIWPDKNKKKDMISIVFDAKGLLTMTSSQGFPLRVTVSRPTDESPFMLIIFEKQKEGIETELLDGIALNFGKARFLSEEEFATLSETHASIPALIDELNEGLNELLKKHRDEREGIEQSTTPPELKRDRKETPKQKPEVLPK